MSEIKLNLIDSQQILSGTIHASVADRAVAALTAEPETIKELKLALERFEQSSSDLFTCFNSLDHIDEELWDAGLMFIDLPARVVMTISTYSYPSDEGEVHYHDGDSATPISIPYRLSNDWKFVSSIEEYYYVRDERAALRKANPPFDARLVLYGKPLLEFIAAETVNWSSGDEAVFHGDSPSDDWPSRIHAKWLGSPRDDLRNQSPRDVLLCKQDLVDFDLHTRELQWSFLHEGPPCLPIDSAAYQYSGFGTHEWVIYFDLVRHLICAAFALINPEDEPRTASHQGSAPVSETSQLVTELDRLKQSWLELPSSEYDNRTPANLIESERKRLPIAMTPRDMVVSDDCPICQMMANDMELANEVGFWHLDGSHMDDGFVFSSFLTMEEWEADRLRWQEFNENYAREKAEGERRESERQTREKQKFLVADAGG